MGLTRVMHDDRDTDQAPAAISPELLDLLMVERETMIRRIRAYEKILYKHKRIRAYSFPPRPK